eukprot:COSAG01_NODE_1332_length_10695_cov_19.161854_6_plen_87_part_00
MVASVDRLHVLAPVPQENLAQHQQRDDKQKDPDPSCGGAVHLPRAGQFLLISVTTRTRQVGSFPVQMATTKGTVGEKTAAHRRRCK